MGFPEIRGTLFGDPYSKDSSILGSGMGFPYFGKLPKQGLRTKDAIVLITGTPKRCP